MKRHIASTDVQQRGCWCLSNICLDSSCKGLVVEEGAIGAVVAAMNTYPRDENVQYEGCWTLVNISTEVDNDLLVAKAGGIDVVVAALRAHPDSAGVQYQGCWALLNTCWDCADLKKRVDKLGGGVLVSRAISRFPSHLEVQRKGRQLLARIW